MKETLMTIANIDTVQVEETSCRLTIGPNAENFVVLYSTVESMFNLTSCGHPQNFLAALMSNRGSDGTWMVRSLCDALDNVKEDTELEVFLTKVQRSISHNRSLSNDAQTPEVKIFAHRKFTILR